MADKKQKRWWEILRGLHNEHGRTYAPNNIDEETLEETPQFDGPYIYTASDLSRLNPPRKSGYIQRFRLVSQGEVRDKGLVPPKGKEGPDFDGMTVSQLRAFAEEHNINLAEANSKSEVLKIVRDADLVEALS